MNRSLPSGKEAALPLQRLLEGDFLRVTPLHENLDSLSVVPHRHDDYELLYVIEGQGRHFINFKEYEIRPGRVYFLHPGQVHLIDRFKRDGWLVMFGSELFERFVDIHKHEDQMGLLDSYTAYPYIDLDSKLTGIFQSIIELIKLELAAERPGHDLLLHYTALLLLYANKAHRAQHPENSFAIQNRFAFYKLKQLIETNLRHQHSAAFYANCLKADIKKLNRICKESTGFTVAGLLKERLLTESKIQLQTSALSVKEISYELGFNDPAFFGRFFKKHTGFTPAEFRTQRLT